VSSQTLTIMNGDWKFEPSHFDDACVGFDGAYELMNMIDFLILNSTIITQKKVHWQAKPFWRRPWFRLLSFLQIFW
jgi:hypothetical protein